MKESLVCEGCCSLDEDCGKCNIQSKFVHLLSVFIRYSYYIFFIVMYIMISFEKTDITEGFLLCNINNILPRAGEQS